MTEDSKPHSELPLRLARSIAAAYIDLVEQVEELQQAFDSAHEIANREAGERLRLEEQYQAALDTLAWIANVAWSSKYAGSVLERVQEEAAKHSNPASSLPDAPRRFPGCPGPDHYGDHSGEGGCGGFGDACGVAVEESSPAKRSDNAD